MRTFPSFGEPQDQRPSQSSGRLKLLYMSHLALGDYVYQGPFLKALTQCYSNIQLDVWLDDCRHKKKGWHAGRSQSLVQWLSSEPFVSRIYPIASSSKELEKHIQQAHLMDYDAIVYVATNRNAEFAKTALKIANHGKVFGTIPPSRLNRLINHIVYKKLDGQIHLNKLTEYDHISDFYQDIFQQFFAIRIDQDQRQLRLNISPQIKSKSAHQIDLWAKKYHLTKPKTIFINHLSTSPKRDWKLSQLEELLLLIDKKFPQSLFILNAPPNEFQALQNWVRNNPKIHPLALEVFTAKTNFFDLPSLMSLCNLVISVETSIMHLASSLNIQQIALIRESAKQWRPLGNSLVLQGKQRVDAIEAKDVLSAAVNL
jgi:ADP-heptose:LPS heptosyltransferase